MPEIICKWCRNKYQAYNNNRKHCSRIDCRNREIEESLSLLHNYFGMLLRHKIIAQVELRCPGNDSFGQQVKVTSECRVDHGFNGGDKKIYPETQLEIGNLINYFRPILQKGLKGNFIVKTLAEGKIDSIILNESFTSFKEPKNILGNNVFISQRSKYK